MPPRDPNLPEGTDHVFDTNIDMGGGSDSAKDGGGSATGTAKGATKDAPAAQTPDSAFKFDDGGDSDSKASGIMGQVKEQISSLKGQAGERARSYADDGKSRATDLLSTIADIIGDAAGSVEDKLGGQYAGIGNRASESIQSLASTLDERSVDDLLEDARAFVKRSPVLAVGIAAVLGFAVARVVRASISEYRGGDQDDDGATGAGGNGAA